MGAATASPPLGMARTSGVSSSFRVLSSLARTRPASSRFTYDAVMEEHQAKKASRAEYKALLDK